MEYAKDEIFSINYFNEKGEVTYKNKKENKLLRFFKNNQIMSSMVILASLLVIINCIFIYNFWLILNNTFLFM